MSLRIALLAVLSLASALAAQAQAQAQAPAQALAQASEPPWLGLLRPRQGVFGVLVVEVYEDSGAAAAGLVAGDELLLVDGVAVSSVADLVAVIQRHGVGDRVLVQAVRDRAELSVMVTLGARVDDRELLHRRLVGKRAPAARLRRIDDDRNVDPSALRGKVVVLAWFPTRCDECAAVIARLGDWTDGRREAEVLAVTSADPALLATYLARNTVGVPVAIAAEEAFEQYGLLGPAADTSVSFVVIDRDGIVRIAAAVSATSTGAPSASVDDVIAGATQLLRARRR